MQLLIKDLDISKTFTDEWIAENCYIAGGACVSNATRQPIHDVDIYFKTREARDRFVEEFGKDRYIKETSEEQKALLEYYKVLEDETIEIGEDCEYGGCKVTSYISLGNIIYVVKHDFEEYTISKPLFLKQKWMFANGYDYVLIERNHFEVDEKIFLGNKSISIKKNKMIYQFILRFYGDPQKTMDETFDFQHCKIAYDLATNEYIAEKSAWEALAKREINYVNSFYPISSLKRLFKYGNRGFKWNNDEFVKIIRDIHEIDTDNGFVIEDQLIGYYEDFDYNEIFGID